MIGQTISHYKILEKLGGGGMGVVYKAEDTKLKRTVALKFLPPELTRNEEAKTRFVHEAQAASALQHPNICTIHDVDETTDHQLFIVMDCYEGETLKQIIERGPLPIDKAVDIATQIAQGLAKAHESGIVHRDIKPANIMVGKDGIARIVDFGLAKLSGRTLLTKTGSTLGTAAYMSPEQARGEQVDHRSDLWSLGVVLYEMLTGKRPFESEYEQALVYSILNQDPRPMQDLRSEVPETLEKICRRAMAKDTKDRYQTASELISDLESYRRGSQLSKSTRRLTTKRQKLAYVGASLVVVLVAMATIYFLSPSRPIVDSIAVLPFENLSGDPEQDYLYDGIATDVIENLQQIRSIRLIIDWQSVRGYKKTNKSVGEIANELGVTGIVTAQVRRMRDSVKISASLTQVSPLKLLSAKSFYRSVNEISAFQADIATAIVREINAVVTPLEQKRIEKSTQVNPQAYEALQKARYYGDKFPQAEYWKTIDYLKLAISLDSTYAPSYMGLASVYLDQLMYSLRPPDEALPLARAALDKALEIDSTSADAHAALSFLKMFEWDWSGAERENIRAINLNPNRGNFFLPFYMGRSEEAIREIRKACEADPRSHGNNLNYGVFLVCGGKHDEAIAQLNKTLALSPGDAYAKMLLGCCFAQKGKYVEAIKACEEAMGVLPDQTVLGNSGWVYAKAGKRKEALVLLDRLKNLPAPLHLDPYNVAVVYSGLGNTDSAFAFLERGYRERSGLMMWLKCDFTLSERLRSDPRYRDLLRRMNFPE